MQKAGTGMPIEIDDLGVCQPYPFFHLSSDTMITNLYSPLIYSLYSP